MKRSTLFGCASMLLLCSPALGAGASEAPLAGRELSPGFEQGETVSGVLFAGWTAPQGDTWVSHAETTGGCLDGHGAATRRRRLWLDGHRDGWHVGSPAAQWSYALGARPRWHRRLAPKRDEHRS